MFQQEFDVQGLTIDALFVHRLDPCTHMGVLMVDHHIYEDDKLFIVFIVKEGELEEIFPPYDDLDGAHSRFMKLVGRESSKSA